MFFVEEKMTTREDKRMVKLEYFSKNALFEHTLHKSTHPLLGAWSIPGPHWVYTK